MTIPYDTRKLSLVVGLATLLLVWVVWPVAWSAVWVGALTALATALIIGLIGVALGAHELVPPRRVVRVRDFGFGAAVFSVVGVLLAFGAVGRVASKIAHT